MDNTDVEALDTAKHRNKFVVQRFDMDSNEHVNNLRYMQWPLESIPDGHAHLLTWQF